MISLALHLVTLFAAAALVVSLLVGASLRLGSRRVAALEPAARSRLMLAGLVAPPFIATLVVGAVVFPHQWLGMADHCLDHPGHLHLCFVHGAPAPSVIVSITGALVVALVALRVGRGLINGVRGGLAVRRVLSAARRVGDVWVLPGDTPLAFTVGFTRPAVVVSAPVLAEATRWRAVLEHERAHATGRHPLVRWIAEALSAFQWPHVSDALLAHLREAQELGADEHAAAAVGCRIEVAEALVEWMRWSHSPREAGVGFHSGPFALRVRRLLDPDPSLPGPSARGLLVAGLAIAAVLCLAAPSLHHAVETALGLLLS